jgi:predicted nucleotide-binding protein (sugar kinase/HSP70/actin superfamily)
MKIRDEQGIKAVPNITPYGKVAYTEEMQAQKYTIIAPQMSPIHFSILEPVFKKHGYNIVVLDNDNRDVIDVGLKYVNNDACYPSITAVGQIMDAVLSGKYDTDKLAIIMSQTGGCCRASNYVAFIRRALDKAGYSHIPVISLNANGMEKNKGFKIGLKLLIDAVKAVVYGDLFMKCLYRVRPYEKVKGSANHLHKVWEKRCIKSLDKARYGEFKRNVRMMIRDFDALPITDEKKPRVGIVGEILVKFLPDANNHLVDLLESEGAEAVMPDLLDFLF